MIRLAVRVRRAQAELAVAELLELVPAGVEEVTIDEQTVEYAVYGAPGELPSMPDLTAAAGEALVEISTSELPDDWHERWKRFHHPVVIEAPDWPASAGSCANRAGRLPSLRVRAPWQAPLGEADVLDVAIDPGQAFGTGSHATTRLCLALMLELVAREGARWPLLDVGVGSGVLAIAAARLGFAPVLGVDHDRASLTAARDNAAANGVAVEIRGLDLRTGQLPRPDQRPHPRSEAGSHPRPGPGPGPRDRDRRAAMVVVANLLYPLLLELPGALSCRPAHLIAGGLLREQAHDVAGALCERLGLRLRARREEGEWAALWLSGRPPGSVPIA
ncbi:MAG TPA: 50S ribosomal protein L11 methyltransferase [Solirubrobacteraceae bacterium]|nr:50S ribosomal protein L11 methyltransferase [Solirubrobacteraceae bacterium]